MIPETLQARSDFFPSFTTDDLAGLELFKKKKKVKKQYRVMELFSSSRRRRYAWMSVLRGLSME